MTVCLSFSSGRMTKDLIASLRFRVVIAFFSCSSGGMMTNGGVMKSTEARHVSRTNQFRADLVVRAFRDTRDPFVDLGGRQYEAAEWNRATLQELSDREVRALSALRAFALDKVGQYKEIEVAWLRGDWHSWRGKARGAPPPVDGARTQTRGARVRAHRRWLATLPAAEREYIEERARQLAGRTRPLDDCGPLCLVLREQAKLTAREIAQLLDALGIEKNGQGACARVQRRIDRERGRRQPRPAS